MPDSNDRWTEEGDFDGTATSFGADEKWVDGRTSWTMFGAVVTTGGRGVDEGAPDAEAI